ncbi:MAG: hypothetical protein AB1426_03885 [Bacillota bacterium]
MLGAEQINAIAGALVNAKPLMGQDSAAAECSPVSEAASEEAVPKDFLSRLQVQTGKIRDGRCYVKVYGDKEDAEKVRSTYEAEGKRPGPLKPDRFMYSP